MTMIFVGIFLSIATLISIILILVGQKYWSRERQIAKRVRDFTKEDNSEKEQITSFILKNDQLSNIPVLHSFLQRLDISAKLQKIIIQAGSSIKVGELILRMLLPLVLFILPALMLILIGPGIIAVLDTFR